MTKVQVHSLEPFLLGSIVTIEKALGPEDLDVITEKVFSPHHPDVGYVDVGSCGQMLSADDITAGGDRLWEPCCRGGCNP